MPKNTGGCYRRNSPFSRAMREAMREAWPDMPTGEQVLAETTAALTTLDLDWARRTWPSSHQSDRWLLTLLHKARYAHSAVSQELREASWRWIKEWKGKSWNAGGLPVTVGGSTLPPVPLVAPGNLRKVQ